MNLYKSMKEGPRSDHGDKAVWKVGEWRKCHGNLEMCSNGYHASKNVIDSMQYVDADVIAQVEVRGKHLEQNDKQCWEEMRLLKTWTWTKEDSVSLAVYAAELVIDIFEARYPDDKRPRQAIDAAKNWLKNQTEENARAAEAAGAASAMVFAAASAAAAWAAEVAAWAAGAAAGAAAWASGVAARAAAWAAGAAARASGVAARAANDRKIMQKCHRFVLSRLRMKDKRRAA